jgi:dTDP-glucose 4,6-dehydratase
MGVAMANVLVTGGLGFIGSHLLRSLFDSYPEYHLFNMDYAGFGSHLKNIEERIFCDNRYYFVKEDINNIEHSNAIEDIDIILNVAAETHVDRSINDPSDFIHSNYNGTFALLEYARKKDVTRYIQVSTDEVYGEALGDQSFTELDTLKPGNPYSSTKAAADLLVQSYFRTYGLNVSITRCTNNFGSHQFPEKLIPRTILRMMLDLPMTIYGSGRQVRDWLNVLDHVKAIDMVMREGKRGQVYNISASNPMTNLDLTERVISVVEEKTGKHAKVNFVVDRPGHDYRYSLDSTKIRTELNWKPESDFSNSLEKTVDWYLNNSTWWKSFVDPYVTDPLPWKGNQKSGKIKDNYKNGK